MLCQIDVIQLLFVSIDRDIPYLVKMSLRTLLRQSQSHFIEMEFENFQNIDVRL